MNDKDTHTHTHIYKPFIELWVQAFLLHTRLSFRGLAFIRQQNEGDVGV